MVRSSELVSPDVIVAVLAAYVSCPTAVTPDLALWYPSPPPLFLHPTPLLPPSALFYSPTPHPSYPPPPMVSRVRVLTEPSRSPSHGYCLCGHSCPEAVRTPDDAGMLPLHCCCDAPSCSNKVLTTLLDAFPEAVAVVRLGANRHTHARTHSHIHTYTHTHIHTYTPPHRDLLEQ